MPGNLVVWCPHIRWLREKFTVPYIPISIALHPSYSKILFSQRGLVRSILNGYGRILSPVQNEMFMTRMFWFRGT